MTKLNGVPWSPYIPKSNITIITLFSFLLFLFSVVSRAFKARSMHSRAYPPGVARVS